MIKGQHFTVVIICSIIFLIFTYGRMGRFWIDNGVMITFLAVTVTFLARYMEIEFKYHSPKFVSDPVFSTAIWNDIQVYGNYAIVKLGGIDWGVHIEGGDEGTAIINIDGLTKCGNSVVSTHKIKPVSVEDLPPEVREIKDHLGLTEPLYLGIISDSIQLSRPDKVKLETELKERYNMVNMLSKALTGKTEEIEKFVEAGARIQERKKGISGFMQRLGLKSFEEEEQK